MNQGIDDATGALERLNKNEDLKPAMYGEMKAKWESQRSQANLAFFNRLRVGEERELARLALPERRQEPSEETGKAAA